MTMGIPTAGLPLFFAAATLIITQLKTNPANLQMARSVREWLFLVNNRANLKNATLEMERSSIIVLEDANMDRSMEGVTGIRLFEVSLPPMDDGGDSTFGRTVEWVDSLGRVVADDIVRQRAEIE